MSAPDPAHDGPADTRKQSSMESEKVHLSVIDYARHNHPQHKYCKFVLDFCQHAFSTEPDSSQQFLDVGCGTGDFTRDVLLPRCLPCRRIIGIDCSQEMIDHARRNSAHEKLDYAVLDITADVSKFLEEFGQFDRVYSFFCLNWVNDMAAALKNISRLMSPTGECLLVVCAALEAAEIYKIAAKMERWAEYAETVSKFIPKTQDVKDKGDLMRFISGLLREADLFPTIMEALTSTMWDGFSEDEILDVYKGMCPVADLVPDEHKPLAEAFLRGQIRMLHAPGARKGHYRMIVVKASKTPY
ncbi:hypothetical protein HPB50_018954 [Hyalomma asiaticum]|uniref:Uncharacterized protein n=1 Tax=Hyalomma asiaticum TaxID=266040 RepID=A0ACB7RRQ8_HYAAI|nr:hypothetical protein HPB50_018954 [Hyalomma asiaticum]